MSFRILQNEKTLFKAIKTRCSKSRQIQIFPKGLTHGFGLKMAVFRTFIFQAIQARKMSFTIFYIEITPLQPIKTKSSESRKTDIFQEGLTHSFGPKLAIFPTFFFQTIYARKMSFTIFQIKTPRFQSIKTRSSKSRNTDIFSKGITHGFCPKLTLFQLFFLGNMGQENVFYDILHRINAFVAYKRKGEKVEKLLGDSRTKKRLSRL